MSDRELVLWNFFHDLANSQKSYTSLLGAYTELMKAKKGQFIRGIFIKWIRLNFFHKD